MGYMTSTNGKTIAIPAGHQDEQLGIGELDSLGDGQRPTMHRIEAVGASVSRNAAGTTDAGNKGDFVRRPADGGQGSRERGHHSEIAAPGTPNRFEIAFKIASLKPA